MSNTTASTIRPAPAKPAAPDVIRALRQLSDLLDELPFGKVARTVGGTDPHDGSPYPLFNLTRKLEYDQFEVHSDERPLPEALGEALGEARRLLPYRASPRYERAAELVHFVWGARRVRIEHVLGRHEIDPMMQANLSHLRREPEASGSQFTSSTSPRIRLIGIEAVSPELVAALRKEADDAESSLRSYKELEELLARERLIKELRRAMSEDPVKRDRLLKELNQSLSVQRQTVVAETPVPTVPTATPVLPVPAKVEPAVALPIVHAAPPLDVSRVSTLAKGIAIDVGRLLDLSGGNPVQWACPSGAAARTLFRRLKDAAPELRRMLTGRRADERSNRFTYLYPFPNGTESNGAAGTADVSHDGGEFINSADIPDGMKAPLHELRECTENLFWFFTSPPGDPERAPRTFNPTLWLERMRRAVDWLETAMPTTAAPTEAALPVDDQAVDAKADDAGMFSVAELAKRYHVARGALEKRLERWRLNHCNGEWVEVPASDRKRNAPKYLYNPACVRPIIDEMRNSRASDKRRTERNPNT